MSFDVGAPELSTEHIAARDLRKGAEVQVSVTATNTGDRDGNEVVQLYLCDPVASIAQPVRRLRGFQRTFLKAGGRGTVRFRLTTEDLGFWTNSPEDRFVVEPGTIEVYAGSSSRTRNKRTLRID